MIVEDWGLDATGAALLTSSVQVGFIVGTFLFALLSLADRYNPRMVFFTSALTGSLLNLGFAFGPENLPVAAMLRFLIGLTLAGVYPVGMKIVASWFQSGLGWRLGVLVGVLTLGTAMPYLLQAIGIQFDWRWPVAAASFAALLGGLFVRYLLTDGPYLRRTPPFDAAMLFKVFRRRAFRDNAIGYIGHMWELYAFWSLVAFYLAGSGLADRFGGVALPAFLVVAAGGLGCVAGGWASRWIGERRVALAAMLASASACLLSGWALTLDAPLLLAFLLAWGFFVVADSAQFSALATRFCPPEYTGTALTAQNGAGFAISVITIQWLPLLADQVGWQWAFLALAPGPLIGAFFMWRLGRDAPS